MNIFTYQIAQYAEVDLDMAIQIQDYMDCWLELNWSEVSNQEIEQTIRLALKMMKEGVTNEFIR